MRGRILMRELTMTDRHLGRAMRSMSMVTCLVGGTVERGAWAPPANVGENAAEVVVMIEVAGVRPEAVSVALERMAVTVAGERTLPGPALRSLHRVEIETGRFRRTIPLPCPVDADNSSYACDNGIIVIRMPKL